MAVTRLKRKTAKNKITAKKRVSDLKRLQFTANIKSPYKDVSGIILEDQESAPAVEKAAPVAEKAAPVVEEVVVAEESSQEEE